MAKAPACMQEYINLASLAGGGGAWRACALHILLQLPVQSSCWAVSGSIHAGSSVQCCSPPPGRRVTCTTQRTLAAPASRAPERLLHQPLWLHLRHDFRHECL